MKDWTAIQKRYLQDELAIRLGGIAANLGRVKSFASGDANQDAVVSLLEESKFFIEWTASETDISLASELVELQVQLSLWQLSWNDIWKDIEKRHQIATASGMWSKRVLELSGLLD